METVINASHQSHSAAQTGRRLPPLLAGPEALSTLLPSAPLTVSPPGEWPGMALRHFRHPPGEITGVRHRDHVLVVNLAGRLRVEERAEGCTRFADVEAGRVSLTPAGQLVSRRWRGHPEVLLIFVSAALVGDVARELDADPARLRLVPRLGVPDGDLYQLGRLLLSEAAAPAPGNALMVEALSRALAVHLLRRHSNLASLPARGRMLMPPRRLARVVEFMREHLDRPLAVSDLASVGGLSASHFTRAFREGLGKSPHAYLIDLRLEQACDMLGRTRRSITEIALSCGFEQSQHFATAFRRRLGSTPTAWRREHGCCDRKSIAGPHEHCYQTTD